MMTGEFALTLILVWGEALLGLVKRRHSKEIYDRRRRDTTIDLTSREFERFDLETIRSTTSICAETSCLIECSPAESSGGQLDEKPLRCRSLGRHYEGDDRNPFFGHSINALAWQAWEASKLGGATPGRPHRPTGPAVPLRSFKDPVVVIIPAAGAAGVADSKTHRRLKQLQKTSEGWLGRRRKLNSGGARPGERRAFQRRQGSDAVGAARRGTLG